ncbi:hypothetical protein Dsin_020274 [Dipteronia sinensis]|uniref:RRM domain-containing protein n=1 Tax=Dipteronia sinensis TaxID=43782 RepID=A0AAE0AA41_9ROSI|nr:hypothetical protein Dsin_020274 [Dipteronia sinensis]
MREKGTERSSDLVSQGKQKDFRDNLASIFVDNPNQKVYQTCLWNLFKVFGRVRDIYLSAANTSRKIGYAFVRFESMEEARRVAEKTNGMHVPIRSKVTQSGWRTRRSMGTGVIMRHKGVKEDRGKMSRVEGCQRNCRSLSYVDVLKDKQTCNVENKEYKMASVELLITDSKVSDSNWLDKSAVGILKKFSNISKGT